VSAAGPQNICGIDVLLTRKDGTSVWVFQCVSRLAPAEGEGPLLQGVLLDITARKKNEEELKEYVSQCEAAKDVLEKNSAELAVVAEELQRSKRSFRVLFSSIPDPVWVFEAEEFSFVEANDVAIRHYGYSRDELAHLKITDLCEPGAADHMRKTLCDPTGPKLTSGFSKHRCKDGHTFPADVRSHLFEFGKMKAILVLVQDRTE
jgi:PAS domain S-box-containing protein